jgi:hypothetical protein
VVSVASIRANQLSSAALDWYASYLAAVDSADIEAIRPFLHPECVLQFNSDLPIYGAPTILLIIERYWSGFRSMQHELINLYGDDSNFAAEMLCHYTRHDGGEVTIPAVSFVDRARSGLMLCARLYGNTNPVFD